MTSLRISLATLLFASMLSPHAYSADGVREINQACALNGCYPGDAPGFPVFITEPGSYKLTGNLDLTGTSNTTGVQIAASFVTLDLNGFEIVGPKVCTGSGPTLDCGGTEDGAGVLVEPDSRAAVIRNGTVRNMGVEGIWGRSDGLTIENVRAINNARDGLRGEASSLVINSMAIENGDDGFDFDTGSVLRGVTAQGNGNDGIEIDGPNAVVDGATSLGNGNRGYKLAHSSKFSRSVSGENAGTDTCGGGVCTDQRRFYLTLGAFAGDEVLSACAEGFHLVTAPELVVGSNLLWDYLLAQTGGPEQSGLRVGANGWVWRSGSTVPSLNCNNWTSTSTGDALTLDLSGFPPTESPAITSSPWRYFYRDCSEPQSVWCIED